MDNSFYSVDDVVKRLNVTPRTLHYYEEMGLITPADRTAGGHRLYNEAVLRKLEDIAKLKEALGYSLTEIRDILRIEEELDKVREAYYRGDATEESKVELLDESIALLGEIVSRIDERLRRLTNMREGFVERLNRAHQLRDR